jgi:hypothetical protein
MNSCNIFLTFLFFLVVATTRAQIEPPKFEWPGVELDGLKGNIKNIQYDEYFARDYFGELIRNTGSTIPTKIIFNEKNQITDIEGITQGIVFVVENEIKNTPLSSEINTAETAFNLQDSSTGNFKLNQSWKYDNNKNIVEYLELRNDTIFEKKIAKYDNKNKLTEYMEYGENGEIREYKSITYDLKGNIIDKIDIRGEYQYHYKYTYNSYGIIIEELNYDKNEVLSSKSNYKFDSKGNKIAMIKTRYNNSKIYTDTTIFTYNVFGKITLEEKKLNRFKLGDSFRRKTYKYDAYNRLLEILEFYTYLQEQPRYESKESYSYNSNGKIVEKQEIRYDNNNEDWKKIEKFDSNGNLIEEVSISNWSNKHHRSVDKFEYDSYGNWIKKIKYYTESPKTIPEYYHITERKIEYR